MASDGVHPRLQELYGLDGRIAIVTGGAGLLGVQHARAIAGAGGVPVIGDLDGARAERVAGDIASAFGVPAIGVHVDVGDRASIVHMFGEVRERFGAADILINNAAYNPKVEEPGALGESRFETLTLERWESEMRVGLTGAFLCAQVVGSAMAERRRGVIVNIASDLAVIAPDQRLYRLPDLPDGQQPVKPVTYSVIKTGLIGLTRYLATYWADRHVRVNALSPGGVFNQQPQAFLDRVVERIPMGRMAMPDEYHGALLFLCSDASSYLTGANLVVDGGRSVW